jgi:phage virion morphogenesis protein
MSARYEITADAKPVTSTLRRYGRQLGNLRPAYAVIGEIVQASVELNFEMGGREGSRTRTWPGLSRFTIEERTKQGFWPGQILVREGKRGGLLGSLSYQALSDRAVISARKKYAAVHQFGAWFQTLKGHRTVKIPARPFLMVQPQDWPVIRAALARHITGSGGRMTRRS